MTIEQGVLDQGRLEIASLLCLQEDVPAAVFMQRQVGATSRARSFAPLADQRWITCALAYLKEMEVISAKRLEFTGGGGKASTPGGEEPEVEGEGGCKGEGKREEGFRRRGGSLKPRELFHGAVQGGQHEESGGCGLGNPLRQTISFQAWALALPRWILRSRTSLAYHLRRSFTAEWRRNASPTATFPLPAPHPRCFAGGGPHLSQRRILRVAQQRALHVAVVILNKLYLGRYASADELGRRPNAWQRKRLCQLRSFYVACGSCQDEFPLAPGRSGPELGACLRQLEKFVEEEVQLSSGYMDFKPFEFKDDPDLFPPADYPELAPYKSLDVERLKLVGTGRWPMEEFLSNSVLWLPFQEPRFLLHGEPTDGAELPSFATESKDENLRLAKVWDAKGLLRLFASPSSQATFPRVSMPTRVCWSTGRLETEGSPMHGSGTSMAHPGISLQVICFANSPLIGGLMA